MKKKFKVFFWYAIILVMVSLNICFHMDIVKAQDVSSEKVRVGFYPAAGYQEKNEDGIYTGFAYDYYVQMQKYTRWDIEYVEASYAECEKMLLDGTIDVMSGLTDTPEREEKFILSNYSICNTQNKLYAREDNMNIYYESYDSFNGCNVGIINGMISDDLTQYCLDHDFSVNLVRYTSYIDLEKALENKEIDMIYASSLSDSAQTKIVARMKKKPLYFAVNKEKTEIAKELNNALQKIIDNNPEFYTQMSEKYKIEGANASATFTREEMLYINSVGKIYFVINPDWAPFTWMDHKTGEYKGIYIDLIEPLEKYSGLTIQLCTEEELNKIIDENPEQVENVITASPDETWWAQSHNVMMTNHIADTSVVMISYTGNKINENSGDVVCALPRNYFVTYAVRALTEGNKIVYYDNIEQCLDAVNSREADITYVNELVSSFFLSKLEYNNLYPSMNSGIQENLSFGVYKESKTPLLSILDKSLLCIGESNIKQIIVKNTHADEEFSIKALFYSNPRLMVGVVLVLCVLIFLIVFFRMKAHNAIEKNKKDLMLARFMGYVCASNEQVMEINLKTFMAQYYSLDDNGNVSVKETPYKHIHHNNFNESIHPDDYGRVAGLFSEDELDKMIDGDGGGRYFECRSKDDKGEYKWYAFSLRTIPKDEEHPRNIILFKKNIDEAKVEEEKTKAELEKALQTAEAANEEKNSFLSRMSHELRTPLNAIMGYSDVMRKSIRTKNNSDAVLLQDITHIEQASQYLLAIIADILDMQKIENGQIEISKNIVNLSKYMENIVDMVQYEANQKEIDFIYENEINVDYHYVIDKVRLQQVLLNVLHNAIKFTQRGGTVRLVCQLIKHNEVSTDIKFVISDNGIGMSEEFMQNQLFKKFAQENQNSTSPYEGCGTGLMICKHLIDLMKGSITCDSKKEEGSTFTIIINAENSETQKADKKSEKRKYDLTGIRVLICEDNPMNQTVEKLILEQMGCSVELSDDGAIGVDMFVKSPIGYYDVILMDIRMPNMDGWMATKEIRAIDRDDAKYIPIIAVSANAFDSDVNMSISAGMNEHMSKPVDVRKLCELILLYCKK